MRKKFFLCLKYVMVFIIACSLCHDYLHASTPLNSKKASKKMRVLKKQISNIKKNQKQKFAKPLKKTFQNSAKKINTTDNAVCNPADVLAVTKGAKLLSTGQADQSVKVAYKRMLSCFNKNNVFFQNLEVVCSKSSTNKYLAKTFKKTCNLNKHMAKAVARPVKVRKKAAHTKQLPSNSDESLDAYQTTENTSTHQNNKHVTQSMPNHYPAQNPPYGQPMQQGWVDPQAAVYGQQPYPHQSYYYHQHYAQQPQPHPQEYQPQYQADAQW